MRVVKPAIKIRRAKQGIAPWCGETICPRRRRWQFDSGKNRGGFTSAVPTSVMPGGGYAAGSQCARSLGSCAMGQTDGRIAAEAHSDSIEFIGAIEIS